MLVECWVVEKWKTLRRLRVYHFPTTPTTTSIFVMSIT